MKVKRRLIILVLVLCILVTPVLIFSAGLYAYIPSFEGTPRNCDTPPCCVTFTNLVTGGALPYNDAVWDFGDGSLPAHGAIDYGDTINHCYTAPGIYTVTLTIWDANQTESYLVEHDYILVGDDSTMVYWSFCKSGFFPKHLPDSYTGHVLLADLVDVPSEVQGVYWYDCNAMEWLFWAPGAPGCTLPILGGGHTYDFMVALTGSCDWEIPLPTPITIPCPEWQTAHIVARNAAVPYGNHISINIPSFGLSGSQPGRVGGIGWYDYRFETGQEGVEQVTGKVYLENAPPGMDILVVAYGGSYLDPSLPQYIQEAFNTNLYLYSNSYVDYTIVESGQSWLLQDEGIQDVFIIVPGYINVKLENIPGEIGNKTVIPDLTLPKEWVDWEIPPPSGCWWWVSWALYPGSAY